MRSSSTRPPERAEPARDALAHDRLRRAAARGRCRRSRARRRCGADGLRLVGREVRRARSPSAARRGCARAPRASRPRAPAAASRAARRARDSTRRRSALRRSTLRGDPEQPRHGGRAAVTAEAVRAQQRGREALRAQVGRELGVRHAPVEVAEHRPLVARVELPERLRATRQERSSVGGHRTLRTRSRPFCDHARSMPCLIALIALLSPRLALFFMLAVQQHDRPGVRRVGPADPRLLPAAVDDARLRGDVGRRHARGLRVRVVHRRPGVRRRPRRPTSGASGLATRSAGAFSRRDKRDERQRQQRDARR